MTPFQQLQVWLRRASVAQRLMTGVASLLLASLIGWLVMPAGDNAERLDVAADGSSGTGQATEEAVDVSAPTTRDVRGDSTSGSTQPAAPAPGGRGAGGGGAGGAATAPAGRGQAAGASCPPGADHGATERQVTLAITLINIAGATGNGTLGVPPPEVQREQWQIVADAINSAGGAGCRQLGLDFYSVNPINGSEPQQKCLEIANDQPFLVIDTGVLTANGASDCIPNQRIPMMASFLTRDQLERYYPYYLAPNAILDDVIRTGVLAFNQQGLLAPDRGFKKLGVLYRTCQPAAIRIMRSTLQEIGMPKNKVVEFNLGCPAGRRNTPVELQQAAVTFKNAGVTHVSVADVGDVVVFSQHAAQQNFKPKYLIADNKTVGTQSGTQQPDPDNFDGAIVVDGTRYGEENTPGASPDAGTQRCNKIFAAAGYPPVWEQEVGYGGVICTILWHVQALLDNVPQMQRTALAPAMKSLGRMEGSYPSGQLDFSATPPKAPWGKPLWRNAVYHGSCRCFQVPDLRFKPALR